MVSYLVPSAAEFPRWELHRTETPSPTNPMGVKGVGETGAIASPAAVMNAVVDALADDGITEHRHAGDAGASLACAGGGAAMIPAPFDYEVAESVDHAIELLGSREEAKVLAGGHSLLPLLRLRLTRPSLLVDVGRLTELSYVRDAGDSIAIGALTRHHDVATAPLLQEHNPLVSFAAGLIGDPQVRHRGTIGGSLAHGDPASDLPAIVLALDGEIDIAGAGGVRTVAARDFFRGVFETAAGPQELVTEVRVPKLSGDHVWSYLKFRRRAQDWATVGVAAVARRSNGGVGGCRRSRS